MSRADRLPGRMFQPWCPYCHGTPGVDCPERSKNNHQVRRFEARQTRDLWHEAVDDRKRWIHFEDDL